VLLGISIFAEHGLEIKNPKSVVVRSSQVSPPELQIYCKNENGKASYQSGGFKEIRGENLYVA
jgi:hypothetical protein